MLTSRRSFAATFVLASSVLVAHAQNPGQAPAVPQPPPAAPAQLTPPPCPISSSTQLNDVMTLLNRIGDIVDRSIQRSPATKSATQPPPAGPAGTDDQPSMIKVRGSTANTVAVEREKLDEIRAEVDQLKAILGSK